MLTKRSLIKEHEQLQADLTAFQPSPPQGYDPANAKIAAFHAAPAKIRALFGGNRSGKSEAGGREIVTCIEGQPRRVAWACGVSYGAIGEYIAPKIFKYLTMPGEIAWMDKKKGIPSMIRLQNQSQIYFKSYDQGREKFQGAACDMIWLDEEPPEDIYDECLIRTVDRAGKLLITMTPLKGLTWIYDRIYLSTAELDLIQHWTISMQENKFLPPAEREKMLALYSQDEIEKRVYGRFMKLEGAVWKEFDLSRNVVPRFPIPRSWRKIRTIDFGYTNPFCCLWIAMNPTGELYVYQEHYQAGMLLKDHAAIILRRDKEGLNDESLDRGIEATVADHDAQDRRELEEYGIFTLPAQKSVVTGIQTVNRAFKLRGGRPALMIFDDLKQTLTETRNYHYPKGRTHRNDSELPEPLHDHAQDAMRYGVMYLAPHSFALREEGQARPAGASSTHRKMPVASISLKQLFAGRPAARA